MFYIIILSHADPVYLYLIFITDLPYENTLYHYYVTLNRSIEFNNCPATEN